jgi:cob(I)alamin adenosyltransferase
LGTGEFIHNRPPTLEEITLAANGWKQVEEAILSDNLDIVVIDEISQVINKGLLPLEKVLTVLKQKPVRLEMVLTGRNMPKEIIELANLVTEMKMVKHPFQRGISAREGIEF